MRHTGQHIKALGRMKQGTMNKTESRYALHLEQLKTHGSVLWWKFEGLKFRLADSTFYTPDFSVHMDTGEVELHEVKGSKAIMEDDAWAKLKIAADLYPFKFKLIIPKGQLWTTQEI